MYYFLLLMLSSLEKYAADVLPNLPEENMAHAKKFFLQRRSKEILNTLDTRLVVVFARTLCSKRGKKKYMVV